MKLKDFITKEEEHQVSRIVSHICILCKTQIDNEKFDVVKKFYIQKKKVFYYNGRPFIILGMGTTKLAKVKKGIPCIRLITPSQNKKGIYFSRVRWTNLDIEVEV